MPWMRRWPGLLCAALVACAPATPEAPAPPVSPTARDAGHADGDRAPADAAPLAPGAPVHRIYDAVVGRPCAPAIALDVCVLCDRHGRAAGVVIPGDYLSLHEDPGLFRSSPDTGDPTPHRLVYRMAVDTHTLRAQVLRCPGCRRVMGWAVIVSLAGLAELAPVLRQRLQVALGWPAEPLLGDAHEFRSAPATEPSRYAPECPDGVLR